VWVTQADHKTVMMRVVKAGIYCQAAEANNNRDRANDFKLMSKYNNLNTPHECNTVFKTSVPPNPQTNTSLVRPGQNPTL